MAAPKKATAKVPPKSIWQELDGWAQTFQPYQRFVLGIAVRLGRLSDAHVDQAYALFLHNAGLADAPNPAIEVPAAITGRPASAALAPVRLTRIGKLHAVNALPSTAELTFSPQLTVIYGGNGVGKSGFARLLSNACFSRTQHPILPNIYEQGSDQKLAAEIGITDGSGAEQLLTFDGAVEHEELRRIAVFDTTVARKHLVDQSPLGFKPAGFDVFPEIARVYGLIGAKLTADIERRNGENIFVKSFVAPESEVSLFVGALSATTDVGKLRSLATFGETETARLEEVQRQITDLQSQSVAAAIKQLEDAKRDITGLQTRLTADLAPLSETQRAPYRSQLADFIAKARVVAEQGSESFKQDFFKSIGSPEWEGFLAAAHALGKLEHADYPRDDEHCLLCHRPLDPPSAALIRRFWGFLASDSRRDAEAASAALDKSVKALKAMRLDFFSADTTVHAHITRLDPALAKQIISIVTAAEQSRADIVTTLENVAGEVPSATASETPVALPALIARIDADIVRLRGQKIEDALKVLEAERIALRHRQVLKQLLPEIEKFVADRVWIQTASAAPRRSLNPRPLTDKETELFGTVIAESYRERLVAECDLLDCNLPVEFRTKGQSGQTVRWLGIKGGHSPDKILSEGEQRAVALADFMTEVGLNPANAGIILDDPVTSQDHQRKERFAKRLAEEAKIRQVIIFTHDLVFLTMLAAAATDADIEPLTHWVERDADGHPGQISLDDCPATTPQYRTTLKAQKTLAEAKSASGSKRLALIQRGMGELRRTIEEIIPYLLLKQVVNRWSDRIIVTGLKNINWQDGLITDIISTFEELSAFIEGHSHTEEKAGAPPEPKIFEDMIAKVNDLIKRAKPNKPSV
ncbi:hypothetical protein [Bradyrhizobium sp. G127]|uniref:AAA family ATPase n=1 Tax=Bradyrhizobium sp. G127 TaxID=2904800 RepID=UPI001F196540|nr:hypothetical protein [Bradyrhizobium sp. G127]MCF2523221.1 hypothetical protein [Bradyrhizobium sp. G127]